MSHSTRLVQIFEEFDASIRALQGTSREEWSDRWSNTPVPVPHRKRRKLTLQKFFRRIAQTLQVDPHEYENKAVPWGQIFSWRMVECHKLLPSENVDRYIEFLQEYNRHTNIIPNKLRLRKPQKEKESALWKHSRTLLHYLRSHQVDPDNALIGLTPSRFIINRYNEWKNRIDDSISPGLRSEPTSPDTLHHFGFPGRQGDLVITPLPSSTRKDKALRAMARASGGQFEVEDSVLVVGRVCEAIQCNRVTFIEVAITPNERTKISIPASLVAPLQVLLPKDTDLRKASTLTRIALSPSDQFLAAIQQRMLHRLDEMLARYDIPILALHQVLQESHVPFTWYHSLRTAAPILATLAQSSGGLQDRYLPQVRRDFLQEWTVLAEEHLVRMKETILRQDGTVHELFVPGCVKDLSRLESLSYAGIASDFFKDLSASINVTLARLTKQRDECRDGSLKERLIQLWISLLNKHCQASLGQAGYDCQPYPVRPKDTWPANLKVLHQLMNSSMEVDALVARLEMEIMPTVEDVVLRYHAILTSELLGSALTTDTIEPEDWSARVEEIRQRVKTEEEEQMVADWVELLAWKNVSVCDANVPSFSVRGWVDEYLNTLQQQVEGALHNIPGDRANGISSAGPTPLPTKTLLASWPASSCRPTFR